MVYSASTRALACLEAEATLGPRPLPLTHYLVELVVPFEEWARAARVPSDVVAWDTADETANCREWGSRWVEGCSSLLARVPSAQVPEEDNILINPKHPGLSAVRATKVRKWSRARRSHRHEK